jgi:8-amino-7-oxononanoate synthase
VRTAERAAERLVALGYHAEFHGAPIVPVVFGNSTLALAAYKQFMSAGVYVNPVGPPAVPEERAGFRTSYMATHSEADIDVAMAVFERFKDDLGRHAAMGAAVTRAAAE